MWVSDFTSPNNDYNIRPIGVESPRICEHKSEKQEHACIYPRKVVLVVER